jgi:hypothetical protein
LVRPGISRSRTVIRRCAGVTIPAPARDQQIARRSIGQRRRRADDRLDVEVDSSAAARVGHERLDRVVLDELMTRRKRELLLFAAEALLLELVERSSAR